MKTGFWFGFAFLIVFPSMAADFPREKMPDRVYAILRDAIDAHFEKDPGNHGVSLNHEGLDELRDRLAFPVFDRLEFWRLRHWRDSSLSLYCWGMKDDSDTHSVLQGEWYGNVLPMDKVAPIEVCDFKEILQKSTADLKECLRTFPTAREGQYYFLQHGKIPLVHMDREEILWGMLGVYDLDVCHFLFLNAYAAAYFDQVDSARTCMSLLLSFQPTYLNGLFDRNAAHAFYHGKVLLEMKRPFREVYEHWLVARKVFGASERMGSDLDELLEAIKPQAMAELDTTKSPVGNPDELTFDRRIEYYIDQLQETCETSYGFSPQSYSLMQKCGPMIEIGTPAISVLIEHLDDRRLTRTVYQGDGSSGPIYRVGDVVNICITKILDFNPLSFNTPLQNADPNQQKSDRKKAMREWWESHQNQTAIEWNLEQLKSVPIWGRIDILRKIEALDPEAVDSLALLKQWAAQLNEEGEDEGTIAYKKRMMDDPNIPAIAKGIYLHGPNVSRDHCLPSLANALADRKDFSLLPQMRKELRECFARRGYAYEYAWYLSRYGDVEDFRYFYQSAKQEMTEGLKENSDKILAPVFSAVSSATSMLTVPTLVCFLDRTEETGSGSTYGEQRFSHADEAMKLLIQRTGHNEGFQPPDSIAVRRSSIERWKQWWEREGKKNFVEAHPEVLGVMGAE